MKLALIILAIVNVVLLYRNLRDRRRLAQAQRDWQRRQQAEMVQLLYIQPTAEDGVLGIRVEPGIVMGRN